MARARYQRGRLFLRGKRVKVWVGRYREDLLEPSGEVRRVERSEVLGALADYPTKKLARRALDAIVDRLNAQNYRAKPLITMEQFAEKWGALVLVNHKPSTQLGVRSVLKKHIIPALGNVQLKDFDAETAQRFISSLALSAKSVRNTYLILRMLWKSAKAWGYVSHDPFDGIVLPKRAWRSIGVSFSLEEVQKILAAAQGAERTFYWLAAETGMRAGELAGISIDNLDLPGESLKVRQSVWRGKIQTPKSESAIRSLALSPELAERLRGFLVTWKPNPARLLFATRNGTPWDCGLLVKRKFHKLLDTLGIPRCGLHAFRHAAASIMDRLDTPLKTRQARLGHADAMLTLQTYTHAAGEDDRQVAAQIGRAVSTLIPWTEIYTTCQAIQVHGAFYCYVWFRSEESRDGRRAVKAPYYVGKGQNGRAYEVHTHGNREITPPKDRSDVLVIPMPTEGAAFWMEHFLIGKFGRLDIGTGCLYNLTDGGQVFARMRPKLWLN